MPHSPYDVRFYSDTTNGHASHLATNDYRHGLPPGIQPATVRLVAQRQLQPQKKCPYPGIDFALYTAKPPALDEHYPAPPLAWPNAVGEVVEQWVDEHQTIRVKHWKHQVDSYLYYPVPPEAENRFCSSENTYIWTLPCAFLAALDYNSAFSPRSPACYWIYYDDHRVWSDVMDSRGFSNRMKQSCTFYRRWVGPDGRTWLGYHMLADVDLPTPRGESSAHMPVPVWRRYWFLAPEHLEVQNNYWCMENLDGCRQHKPWDAVPPIRLAMPHPSLETLCADGADPPINYRFELFWFGIEYNKQQQAIKKFEEAIEKLQQGKGKLQSLLHAGNPFPNNARGVHVPGRIPYSNKVIPEVFSGMPALQAYVDQFLPRWACANATVPVPFPTTLATPCAPRVAATTPRLQTHQRLPNDPQPPQPPAPDTHKRKAPANTVTVRVAPNLRYSSNGLCTTSALSPPAVPPPGQAPSPLTGTAGASGSGVTVPPAVIPVPPAVIPVPPVPWDAELHDVHRAYRRMALRHCFDRHRRVIGDNTLEAQSRASDLAHKDYVTFMGNGVRHKSLTQAMADGPLAITPADTTWLKDSLARVEGEYFRGFWRGP
jgi:hypothetical protein